MICYVSFYFLRRMGSLYEGNSSQVMLPLLLLKVYMLPVSYLCHLMKKMQATKGQIGVLWCYTCMWNYDSDIWSHDGV